MRKLAFGLSFLAFSLSATAALADRIQLPCDGDLALTAGSDLAAARTEIGALGQLGFSRFSPFSLGLEARLIDACASRKKGTTTRFWLGRLTLNGGLGLEKTTFALSHTLTPVLDLKGQPINDADGNPTFETGLSDASFKSANWSWSAGLRLALLDLPHFHLESYASASGSLGWTPTETESAKAYALDRYWEIGWYLHDNVALRHRWRLLNAGLTIGSPWRLWNDIRLTPEVTLGYARLDVAVKYSLSAEFKSALDVLQPGTDVSPKSFSSKKLSPVGHFGLRADVTQNLSFDLAAMAARSGCYWMAASATVRFDVPWRV